MSLVEKICCMSLRVVSGILIDEFRGARKNTQQFESLFTIVGLLVANICNKPAYINRVNYPPKLDLDV